MNKKDPKKQIELSKFTKGLLISTVVVAAYCLTLFIPLISPFAWFPVYAVKCGGLPVVANDFAAAYTYKIPGDTQYAVTPFTTYFCSEDEAKRAGFHND